MSEQLAGLHRVLQGCTDVLILPHNDPDPDAIAGAVAMRYLLDETTPIRSIIGFRGIIGRAENRALERFLGAPLAPLEDEWLRLPIILVDTQPGAGNNAVVDVADVVAVVDHHPLTEKSSRVPFADIRQNYGATATIVTEYLLAAGLSIPSSIATALFYGIKTDTVCLTRGSSEADLNAILALQPLLDQEALSRIERAQVSPEYFRAFQQALDSAYLYDSVLFAYIGDMLYPDWAAEMADWLLRLESVQWVICMGVYRDTLYMAVRTRNMRGGAGKLAQHMIGRRGMAGGHGLMAGGQVKLNGQNPEPHVNQLRDRALQRLRVPESAVRRKLL